MLRRRRDSETNITRNDTMNIKDSGNRDDPNSAEATAISCRSEKALRVPNYCEENVWRLAYRRLYGNGKNNNEVDKENEQYYVVFVSNDDRCCPMFNQRASESADSACVWDYHVILIQSSQATGSRGKKEVTAQVLDMDSRLSFPSSLDNYLNRTFQEDLIEKTTKKKFPPKFRVVRAELYLRNFYSDRMHMFHEGKWYAEPPKYNCILTDAKTMKKKKGIMSNLNDYISMSGGKGKESSVMGEVLTLKELRSKFGLK